MLLETSKMNFQNSVPLNPFWVPGSAFCSVFPSCMSYQSHAFLRFVPPTRSVFPLILFQLNCLHHLTTITDTTRWLRGLSLLQLCGSIAQHPVPYVSTSSLPQHHRTLGLCCCCHPIDHLLYRTLTHFAFCKINFTSIHVSHPYPSNL